VAIVLSSIVLTGVYSLFDSIINTKSAAGKSYDQNTLLMAARKIIKPDALQMYKNTLKITRIDDNNELEFKTANSIKLEKAVPVTVRYYVEDEYLIREETNIDLNYEWRLYLLRNVSDFEILAHNGYKFEEEYDPSDTILQVSFKVADIPVKFVAGGGLPNLSTGHEGDEWK
jgi:hypothetical protein